LGNLIDRLTLGTVTDFISIGSFAVFNIADASISIGVAVLVLTMWWEERRGAGPAESPVGVGGERAEESSEQNPV
jgi:signal peptidase II